MDSTTLRQLLKDSAPKVYALIKKAEAQTLPQDNWVEVGHIKQEDKVEEEDLFIKELEEYNKLI